MIDTLLRIGVKLLLWLRYRIRVTGLEEVARRGTRGILFLPNHPALIDPIIVVACLHRRFSPHALADKDQIDRFFIRWAASRVGVRPVPDLGKYGPSVREEVQAAVAQCLEDLRQRENLVLYPAGRIYRSRYEDLRGNSAVETILRELPDVRVVLVRTRGLWGSSFSMASGGVPNVARNLRRHALSLLKSLVFFAPRREVSIELCEPADLPRDASRRELNDYLQRYYNEDAPPNTYVPYTPWESGGTRPVPDPPMGYIAGTLTSIPPTTRQLVLAHLRELTGREKLRDEDRLAEDLGVDSLAKAEIVLWLSREFGFSDGEVDALQTIGDVLLATRGEAVVTEAVELKPVPPAWFRGHGGERVTVPPGDTITEVFLAQARRHPHRLVIADQLSGAKSYRDVITAIMALRPLIEELPGQRVGIMLPASVVADVVYLASLFAGKVPIMVNWTTGTRNITHALELADVQRVLTAGALVARIESQGTDLSSLKSRCVFMEELGARISTAAKLWAWLRSRLSWASLACAPVPETAVILLTSGSESLPKAVPLTHANILTNLRDVVGEVTLRDDDCMVGFLPPFHSFGLTVTLLAPLLAGMRAVYHANPTQAWVLAPLIEAYGATLLCGTPTFLSGIVRAASGGQLDSLRLAVTGAEKCPERTYEALAQRCPQALILEGYGITECSPIVSVAREQRARPGTIGEVLPSLEHVIVDVDEWREVEPGATGMLLVRGPSVFGGYLGHETASPFVEFAGKAWYRTGDLVSADQDGVLTFRGRLKRFVKRGGEMISLPAVEAVLEAWCADDSEEGPTVAVTATPDEEHPELVLFATREVDRNAANAQLRAAGLSPLHNIARVERLEQLPVLGTGKTDYRALDALLAGRRCD